MRFVLCHFALLNNHYSISFEERVCQFYFDVQTVYRNIPTKMKTFHLAYLMVKEVEAAYVLNVRTIMMMQRHRLEDKSYHIWIIMIDM